MQSRRRGYLSPEPSSRFAMAPNFFATLPNHLSDIMPTLLTELKLRHTVSKVSRSSPPDSLKVLFGPNKVLQLP
jgi:hypothetical protein